MKKLMLLPFLICLAFSGYAQQTDTLVHKLDSLKYKADSAGGQINNTNKAAYNDQTILTPRSYFILLGSNIKQQFTKPFHMVHQDWIKLGGFALGMGALALADEPIQQGALRFRDQHTSIVKVGTFVTNFGGVYELVTLGTLGLYGFVAKNQKMKTTTLLASQAYITGAAMESVLKFLSGRTRPNYYGAGTEAEPKFTGPFGNTSRSYDGKRSNSSFPSGHTAVAFAAATVYAMEYRNTGWVPVLSYTAASLIGLSRITENKHWATDIFAGAALGLLSGRQVVNNYHRYAKIKDPKLPRNRVAFNIQYESGHLEPELRYKL